MAHIVNQQVTTCCALITTVALFLLLRKLFLCMCNEIIMNLFLNSLKNIFIRVGFCSDPKKCIEKEKSTIEIGDIDMDVSFQNNEIIMPDYC